MRSGKVSRSVIIAARPAREAADANVLSGTPMGRISCVGHYAARR
jgi:hypothetical protein